MGRNNFSHGRRGGGRGRGGRGGGRGGGHNGGGRGGSGGRGGMASFRGPGYNDGVAKSVDEKVVGITRYLTPDVPGFHGTIKERFSDFIVREVSLNGDVAQLTDLMRKQVNKKEQKISEIVKHRVLGFLAAAPHVEGEFPMNNRVRGLVGKLAGRLLGLFNQNKRLAAASTDRLNIAQLKQIVTEICDGETADRLAAFMEQILEARIAEQQAQNANELQQHDETAFVFPVVTEKEQRMRIHQSLRELGANLVVSDTIQNAEGAAVIRVRRMLVGGKKRKDMDQRVTRVQWPADRGDFLQFVLFKKNMETMAVVSNLARALGVNQSSFSYAGTKDKRGITTQWITVYRGSIERLAGLNKGRRELQDFNFLVGNATYVQDRLNLGDLRGNQFTMAIRSLPDDSIISDDAIHSIVKSWAARGFINYFGLQRFGTRSIATHEVGRAILRRDHKQVIDLIMAPQEGDASKITEARQHFQETQDIDAAIASFPPYFIAEHSILQGLKTHGLNAHTNAIACIPRHLRMMYTHAYQSFVWNTIASERLDRFPTDKPIVGDLVLPQGMESDDVVVDDVDVVVNDEDTVDVDEQTAAPTKKRKLSSKAKLDVVVVTEDNLSQYSIYDVVLPLPGYDITLPQNEVLKARYEELLRQDGVDFQSLSRATNSEYHLPGSYRHLLRKPLNVKHEIKCYNDPTIELLDTDVDRLEGKSAAQSIPDAKFRALCLEFQLNASSYATMAVRELMKQSSNLNVHLHVKEQQASK